MTESKTNLVETVKLVQEKVTKIRWVINDFSRVIFAHHDDPIESGQIKMDNESEMKGYLTLWPPFEMQYHEFSLELYCRDFGRKKALEVRCKFWIENSSGEKYGEIRKRRFIFLDFDDIDENDLRIRNFLNRQDLVKNFTFNGPVTICGEVRWRLSNKEYVQPKIDSEFRQKLWTSYQEGFTNDIIIQVKDKQFNISKSILAANSDVFLQMLRTENCKEVQTGIVEIKEANYDVVKAFVEYLHRGQVNNLSKVCPRLFILAHRYMIAPLQIDCVKKMVKSLNKNNVVGRLKTAFLYEEETLKNATIAYITSPSSDFNFRQLFTSVEWMQFAIKNTSLAQEISNAVFDKMKLFREQDSDIPSKRQKLA